MHDRRMVLGALAGSAILWAHGAIGGARTNMRSSPWSIDNLFAWCVVPFDAKKRTPAERAAMLKQLGFRAFAYDWRETDIPHFAEEIEALKREEIDLVAWYLARDPSDPLVKSTLEILKEHDVQPTLWVMHLDVDWAQVRELTAKRLPEELRGPKTPEFMDSLPRDKQRLIGEAFVQAMETVEMARWPRNPREQADRVAKEAAWVKDYVDLARPYGLKVALYSHNGWAGVPQNQLAMIRKLRAMGAGDVRIVYNFSHARDGHHDDSKDFRRIWRSIQPHVAAVNIAGVHREDGTAILPTQGDAELEMMRIIEESGWQGPVGLIAESGGDAAVTLANAKRGLDWLAAEIARPGSGGPRPEWGL